MKISREKGYKPHNGQKAFHYAIDEVARFVAMICGVRGGKTFSGSRQALKMSWNSKGPGVFGIIAPTYKMLKRTTWREFKMAADPWILNENKSDHIITLKNGREIMGFTAEDPDSIRNVTLNGFWVDEAREAKCFSGLWNVLMGRVLSTGGKGIVTSSPNGYDDLHRIFVEKKMKDYLMIRFSTYENTSISKEAIDDLAGKYDEKFMRQEIYGEFVVFEGQVYYTFDRHKNASELAFKKAQYDPDKPINLCCDFNVDPMAWELCQTGKNEDGEVEVYWIDEIYVKNSNTLECCQEFKERYRNHKSGLYLYGDATGKNRSTTSNVTNWQIIENELQLYMPVNNVPTSNPPERSRINAVNAMIRNSKGKVKTFVNPKTCTHLMRDFEQVPYKEGTPKIDKMKNKELTHASDSAGYFYAEEFSLVDSKYHGTNI